METYIDYLGARIPFDDLDTFKFLAAGKNLKGIFQFETSSAAYVLEQIQPKTIEDLSICNALNRPGSMKFTTDVGEIRAGKQAVTYLDKAVEPFLKDTAGKLIYQEQLLLIAQKLAGFSGKDSNALLKAIGKKKMDVMKAQRDTFIAGMLRNGYSKELAENLFKWFEDFANYSFNKSHAVSYSVLGYISAYIKLHNPLQFFTSLLNYTQYEQSPQDEIFDIVAEAPAFGIKILPPSIKCLNENFTIEKDGIRFPLKFVRQMGDAMFEKLKGLKDNQISTLEAVLEFLLNVGLNSRSTEFLIASGAMDCYGKREDILYIYWFLSYLDPEILTNFWNFQTGKPLNSQVIQEFLNYDKEVPGLFKRKGRANGYFKTEATRKKTLAHMEEKAKLIEFYKGSPTFARFWWESYVLGFSYEYHFNPDVVTFRELNNRFGDQHVTFGFVNDVIFRTAKKSGKLYAKLDLKLDKHESFMLFDRIAEGAKDSIEIGDFVRIEVIKNEGKANVTSILNVTDKARKYAFWERQNRNTETSVE